jgi:hypothetical protein
MGAPAIMSRRLLSVAQGPTHDSLDWRKLSEKNQGKPHQRRHNCWMCFLARARTTRLFSFWSSMDLCPQQANEPSQPRFPTTEKSRRLHSRRGSVYFGLEHRHSVEFVEKEALSCCNLLQQRNLIIVPQFDADKVRAMIRISMKKTGNAVKSIWCQLPMKLGFTGMVHQSQGMALESAVLHRCTEFWKHSGFDVALSEWKVHPICSVSSRLTHKV